MVRARRPFPTGVMSIARLEGPGHTGRPVAGLLHMPEVVSEQERAAVLLLHVEPGLTAEAAALTQRLVEEGLAVLVLDAPADGLTPPDRPALLDLEAALTALADREDVDAGRVAAVGLGRGGTLAFLAGCASRRLAAVVDAGGPLVRGELSAKHPVEPLELALNLGAPLLVLFGAEDPATTADHAAHVEAELARALRNFELERVPRAGSCFLERGTPGYHPDTAHAVRERIVVFLRESLELD